MNKLEQAKISGSQKRELARAGELVKLGAPLQVLESETKLTRQRLSRLYKNIRKQSLPAELLAVPMDWFMNWQPNTHATAFLNVYEYLIDTGDLNDQDVLAWSYRIYLEQLKVLDLPKVLSLAHAWRLVQYVDSGMLMLRPCNRCERPFVVHTANINEHFVCVQCQTPPCAGGREDASVVIEATGRGSAKHLN